MRHRSRGGAGVGGEGEAQTPDERRVFEQVAAQAALGAQALVEFDQVSGDVGGARRGGGAGPGVVGRAFGEVVPIQRAEQGEVLAGDRILRHKVGQVGGRVGQVGQVGAAVQPGGRYNGRPAATVGQQFANPGKDG